MLMPDVKVTKQVEERKYELDGTPTALIRTEFYVGKHGPFVEKLPKDGWSAQVRDDKLNAFANEVRTTP